MIKIIVALCDEKYEKLNHCLVFDLLSLQKFKNYSFF